MTSLPASSHPAEGSGATTGPGPGPVADGARPHSLRRRLVAGLLGIVLLMAAVMGALSTLTLRHTLLERLDQQINQAAERAATKRHASESGAPARSSERSSSSGPRRNTSEDGARYAHGATDPTAQPTDGTTPGPGSGLPPGLDAPGQSTGTLSLVQPAGGGTPTGGYIDASGAYRTLTEAEQTALLSLDVSGRPVTVDIESLGDYRVLATKDPDSGDLVVTGLSLAEDNDLIRTQLLLEAAIALTGAVIAGLVGRAVLGSALAPLERVAATARRVASQPLARGEVTISERVPARDLGSSDEIAQVGQSLNTLLGHVENALVARQRSETQVRQFVADASHELRTPLASIRGYTELVRREAAVAELPEDAVHALDRVASESVRMTGLVEDLLLLARLDAGRDLEREEVDLVGVLLDTIADARAAGPDHVWGLALPAIEPPEALVEAAQSDPQAAAALEDFEPEPALVVGDDHRLRQVLVNLLANARVHTPPGTHVTTTLSREGEHLVVTVADDGPGIAPELRERLFERFTRGDSSRERSTGSTGLGMSIAAAVVRAHHGTLTVDSVPGRTVFTVALPVTPPLPLPA